MQITACKKKKNTTLSKDIDDLMLQRTFGKPDYNQLKRHDNNVAFMDV